MVTKQLFWKQVYTDKYPNHRGILCFCPVFLCGWFSSSGRKQQASTGKRIIRWIVRAGRCRHITIEKLGLRADRKRNWQVGVIFKKGNGQQGNNFAPCYEWLRLQGRVLNQHKTKFLLTQQSPKLEMSKSPSINSLFLQSIQRKLCLCFNCCRKAVSA